MVAGEDMFGLLEKARIKETEGVSRWRRGSIHSETQERGGGARTAAGSILGSRAIVEGDVQMEAHFCTGDYVITYISDVLAESDITVYTSDDP